MGRGEDDKKVHEWLEIASSVPGFIGFAVGRTTFWEPVVDWRAGKLTREAAVAEVAAVHRPRGVARARDREPGRRVTVPFTRTLPYVLRDQLARRGLDLFVAEVASVVDESVSEKKLSEDTCAT